MRRVAFLLLIAAWLPAAPARAQCTGEGGCPVGAVPPAVVRVVNTAADQRWYGSGTLVYKDQRHAVVLTCAHLFRQQTGEVVVLFPDGGRFQAEVLGVDRVWDLAALRIAPPAATPTAIAAEPPRPGDVLRSCGYGPDGRYRCNQGRALGYARPALNETFETLELSGSARDGDSGGPVFNARGELVAVLWGTDGRTVGGTYCGRLRRFLAAIFARLRPPWRQPDQDPAGTVPPPIPANAPIADDQLDRLRQRLDDQERSLGDRMETFARLAAALKQRLERAEATVGEGNLRALVREAVGSTLTDHRSGLLETALPALMTALGWSGPPSLAVILALRLGTRLLRRRRQKRSRATVRRGPRPLNDEYAQQLAEVYALSGHSQVADATLGREYDEELSQAEQSSDGALARWARQLRQRVAKRFYRVHGESPAPAEPT